MLPLQFSMFSNAIIKFSGILYGCNLKEQQQKPAAELIVIEDQNK